MVWSPTIWKRVALFPTLKLLDLALWGNAILIYNAKLLWFKEEMLDAMTPH